MGAAHIALAYFRRMTYNITTGERCICRCSPHVCALSQIDTTYPYDKERYAVSQNLSDDAMTRHALIESHIYLVSLIAHKYARHFSDNDELISVGTIGLVKAGNTYDPGRNVKFATYATRCIENEIAMYIRYINRRQRTVSLHKTVCTDIDGNRLHLEDVLGTAPDMVNQTIEAHDELNMLSRALESLDESDRRIIVYRYGLNGRPKLTQSQLAERLGLSQSCMSRLEKRIVLRLRAAMERMK